MSQPIVPFETPPSRRFDKKNKNEMVLKMRIGRVELSLFQSLHQETLDILDKVLLYDHSTQ
jgi:IS66 family element